MARARASGTQDGGRREAILAAALQCFGETGIEAAAIGDIGARSGASVGSIYHHFGSKEGIARALFVEGLRRNMELLAARLAAVRGAEVGVRTLVLALIDWIGAHPDWARFIYMVSSSRFAAEADAALRELSRDYGALIESYFGPYFASGALRALPRECFAPLVIGPVHDYARRWLNGQAPTPLAGHAALFADAAWEAVRARP
ncbi:TetR/AcrR family transcriptional regulator [Solimonas variicoloris]|uniref:TetR/AcrR family transcriptional regulator n=1 Tax=Solimonas variicoloris TaxID=254408 RepID=UPI00036BD0DE|nr:TetR/AcrR family transcriptional regulator [Solimonas variicoloris]